MLFHVGALWRLNLLGRTVSRLQLDEQGVAATFVAQVVTPLSRLAPAPAGFPYPEQGVG